MPGREVVSGQIFINKILNTMKAQQVIENYCSLYHVDTPKINIQEVRYFVTISPGRSDVLYLHKPSKLLGQIIGAAMKRGTVLYICHGKVIPITWENWKQIWDTLFAQKARDHSPVPNFSRPYKSKIFEELQQKDVYRKPQKRSIASVYTNNKSMDLLAPVRSPGIRILG